MRHMQKCLLLTTALLAAATVPLLALGEPVSEPADERQQLLAKWREEPELYARLKHDLGVFQKLPLERQEKLRKLDRDLQDENGAMRARLNRVLGRYSDWLERLPEAERQSIEKAPDRKARVQRVKELREQQWIKRLPKAQRELIAKTKDKERIDLVKKLWDEDWEQRADWQVAARYAELLGKKDAPLPVRLDMLPDGTRKYVSESLLPLLSKEEERRLKDAESKWPRYPRVLVELADSHPLSVLGPIGPIHMSDLHLQVQDMVKKGALKKVKERLNEADGKWPEFGAIVRELYKGPNKLASPMQAKYMPARPHEFSASIQQFLEKRLLPALDEADRRNLNNTIGHWPAYPKLILELAAKHNLPVPTDTPLPGPIDFWDIFRARSVSPLESTARRVDPFVLVP